jgi:crotonobetainyl-CoA:carnitine CoA-transferase CaiB-like acyl-CoA transferase
MGVRMPFSLLAGIRVVDLSTEIAGPYGTKLLADAGADVIKVETVDGDPLRRWSAGECDVPGHHSALFEFLNAGKRGIVAELASSDLAQLVAGADLVVEEGQLGDIDVARLRESHPHVVIASVTWFGRTGPWAARPATEFTLQAECASIIGRGHAERPPVAAGGRLGEWVAGSYLAVSCLAALRASRNRGFGDHIDLSIFEAMCSTMAVQGPLSVTMNPGPRPYPRRAVEVPSVEQTADGYVGFCVVTAQQFQDFLLMMGRQDLADDPELSTFGRRRTSRTDFVKAIRDWTGTRTTEEIVELASMLRIPVAPVGAPETVCQIDHFAARGIYGPNATGDFVQPRSSYLVDGAESRPDRSAPKVGEHNGDLKWISSTREQVQVLPPMSIEDLRILDLTSFWAGPFCTELLALLGADVIHVESVQHPDGMRFTFTGNLPTVPEWWESSSGFHNTNANKRGITLDLNQQKGRDLLFQLIKHCDAVVENFSPRVLDHFGITWDDVHLANPTAVMLRMPAFGLDGPWRDRTGFAQTMEQATGMAWITGYADGPPLIPRGPCDPIAGLHSAVALLSALTQRDRTGQGLFIEAPMVEAALNVAAEIVIEQSAYGRRLGRQGNRGLNAAPQGVYACAGEEQWLALAVATDDQWDALVDVLGRPAWAGSAVLGSSKGRREHHDLIDEHLHKWLSCRRVEEVVEELLAAGVPAGRVVDPLDLLSNPQLRARGALEMIDSPVVGQHETISLPFRLASRSKPWIVSAAPTLGQHNYEILQTLLGIDRSEIAALEAKAVIGSRPVGLKT